MARSKSINFERDRTAVKPVDVFKRLLQILDIKAYMFEFTVSFSKK